MEYSVIYQNSAFFCPQERPMIEEVLQDISAVAFDSNTIQLKIGKNNNKTECQVNIIKSTELLASKLISADSLAEALDLVKSDILDKILEKNVFILSNVA